MWQPGHSYLPQLLSPLLSIHLYSSLCAQAHSSWRDLGFSVMWTNLPGVLKAQRYSTLNSYPYFHWIVVPASRWYSQRRCSQWNDKDCLYCNLYGYWFLLPWRRYNCSGKGSLWKSLIRWIIIPSSFGCLSACSVGIYYNGKGQYFIMILLAIEMPSPLSFVSWMLAKAKLTHLSIAKMTSRISVYLWYFRTLVELYFFYTLGAPYGMACQYRYWLLFPLLFYWWLSG